MVLEDDKKEHLVVGDHSIYVSNDLNPENVLHKCQTMFCIIMPANWQPSCIEHLSTWFQEDP
jgi:hypothetical protein